MRDENEKDSIKRYSQGEALFVCGNRRMQINVVVTNDELESFGSGGGFQLQLIRSKVVIKLKKEKRKIKDKYKNW